MNPVRIGLLGLGTVGGGTLNVLRRNGDEIARRAGRAIEVTRASVRDLAKERICDTAGIVLTSNPEDVVDADDVDVVVELIGGCDIARDLVMRAIAQGKHVVTANKALIALHGNELFSAARERGVIVAFEAAVAGGIPIIKAIREGLAGNVIESVEGIINGTGNYILSQMRDKGRDFADALADAQALGYAEADPSFDVEGIDAAHKLTILAAIAFGKPLAFERVYTEGISAVTREDVDYASELGYRVKHLGIARRRKQGVELRVHPTFIPERRPIAAVDGVMNAVQVRGDAVGTTLYSGAGAGAEPTASAIVADLVDVVRALTTDPENRVPHLAFQADAISELPILDITAVETAFYLRILAEDRPGVLADVARILGDHGISLAVVLQKEPPRGASHAQMILLTHHVVEGRMREAIARIEALASVQGSVTSIRVESLD